MKIDCDVPCGIDPQAIKRVYSAAWQAAARNLGWKHPVPKRITKVRTRKGSNPAWCDAMQKTPYTSVRVYLNPRRSMRQHAIEWYDALGGRGGPTFDDILPDAWPKAPPKAKRTKRELAAVEKLTEARARVAEWEQKKKDANRALRLAKTKLRRYKAQVRALERSVHEVAPEKTIGYDSKAFSAHMRERIGGAS
jgi:hypothetical protein